MEAQKMTLLMAVIATVAGAILMFLLRAFPFLLFSSRKPPQILSFVEKYIPAMVIGVLIIYCLSDPKYLTFTNSPWGIPAIIGIAVTTVLHIAKGNSMISIFGGTIVYMMLDRLFL